MRLESAERFVAATGAVIVHGGDRAYYRPSEDFIQLPPVDQFRSSEGYYATALHELNHWSGHKSRLDRDLKGRYRCAGLRLRDGGLCRRRAGGGDRCGLPVRQGRGDGRASGRSRPLPQSWIAVLKGNNRAIFTAASQAQKAADYLVGLQPS